MPRRNPTSKKLPRPKRTVAQFEKPRVAPLRLKKYVGSEDIAELVRFTNLMQRKIKSDVWGKPEHMPANVRIRLASEINGIANKFHADLEEYRRAPDAAAVRSHFSRICNHAHSLFMLISEQGESPKDFAGDPQTGCSPFVEYMLLYDGMSLDFVRKFPSALLAIKRASHSLSRTAPSFELATGAKDPTEHLVVQMARLFETYTGAKPRISSDSSILSGPFPQFAKWICSRINAEISPKLIRKGLAAYPSTLPKQH